MRKLLYILAALVSIAQAQIPVKGIFRVGVPPVQIAGPIAYNRSLYTVAPSTATGSLQTGIIPFTPGSIWSINNPAADLSRMFTNTNPGANPPEYYGQLYSVYPLFQEFDSVAAVHIEGFHYSIPYGDYSGNRKLQVYGTLMDGTEQLIWTMDGVGKDRFADVYDPITPVTVKKLRYAINANNFPIYLKLQGSYYNVVKGALPQKKYYPLKNQFGNNTQTYDWSRGENPHIVDPALLNAMSDYTGQLRLYVNRDQFEPTKNGYVWTKARTNGGWSIDAIMAAAKLKGLQVNLCPVNCQPFIKATYPDSINTTGTTELPPMFYGEDKSAPYSYRNDRDFFCHMVARYGSNTDPPAEFLHVDSTPEGNFPGAVFTSVKKGLGQLRIVELDNERDKWWKGEVAHQTGAEFAAYASMVYDGHMGQFGKGVKQVDSNVLVMFGGVADWSLDYFKHFRQWVIQNRGYKPNGVINWPIDILAYHNYWGTGAGQYQGASIGSCVEKANPNFPTRIAAWNEFVQREMNGLPYICNEIGYDKFPDGFGDNSFRAPTIGTKTPEVVAADWQMRYALLAAANGQAATSFYWHRDDLVNYGLVFSGMGWRKEDLTRFAASNYAVQFTSIMGNASFVDTLVYGQSDKYVLKFSDGKNTFIVGWMGSQTGAISEYAVPFTSGTSITVYKPQPFTTSPSSLPVITTGTTYIANLTETPIIIKVN